MSSAVVQGLAMTQDTANDHAGIDGQNVAHDEPGNLIADAKGLPYLYDFENQLTNVYVDVNTNGEYNQDADTLYYPIAHDALERRIEKADSTGGGRPHLTRCYYDA